MKVLLIILLTIAAAATSENLCPKIQEIDWNIELLLPHQHCNKFYQCVHGQPVEMSCPKRLLFSINKQVCDWRADVDCGDRIIVEDLKPDDEESEEVERPVFPVIEFLPNGCPVNREIHWLLPHEKSCSLFYYCVQGEREVRRCPFWLHFNRKLQVCDWPRNSGCIEFAE